MSDIKKKYFGLLKQDIVSVMQESFPGINLSISHWKGQEITDFQEDLLIRVNAHISEKWFYNHIKTENDSLPRIDILNILSKYVGFANWADFVFHKAGKIEAVREIPQANRMFVIIPIAVVLIMIIMYFLFHIVNIQEREYNVKFYDTYTKEIIVSARNEIVVLSDNESPIQYLSDSTGIIIFKTNAKVVEMVVSSPYYISDTISRMMKSFNRDQKIGMKANDYALILHYFSEMNVEDWQSRKAYLSKIIDDDAIIYQVLSDKNKFGMALYNKMEFIDKLTMPSGSLKNIEILETQFKKDKIALLRFRINF
ncbi:MAG: hypothetical protein KAH25_00315 [Bacteroidales bacterium]|nr:hypothetical protein [Bacteroidales bacterium]